MEIKQLDRLSVCLIDCRNYGQGILSLKKTLSQIKPARTIFFTDVELPPQEGIEVIRIASIRSKAEYSEWIIRELAKYITTEFVLLQQWDSWVLDSGSWTDEFLGVDFVGSAWLETDGFAVGNGGFSIRSKRLMEAVANDPMIVSTHPEDNMLCKVYRPYLESKYGFKWASIELADRFAFELKFPIQKTFGFHSFFHKPFQETVVIHRTGAVGDTIMCEPVLHYFFKRGYRVILDTLPRIFNFFAQHYYKIHHPEEVDPIVLANARVINLDMGYEVTPSQLHLKSFYEVCGIQDGEIRNPRLSLAFDHKIPEAKLFKKYVVLHLDRRPQHGRNIYGVDWGKVVDYLHSLDYTVIQIGQGEHHVAPGAVEMVNINELMLMRLIGGADFMIAIDSGPANIAVALDVKLIAFFGSVDPHFIYPDLTNIEIIQHENVCRLPKCWHSKIGTEGVECVETNGRQQMKVQMMQGSECVETSDIPPCVMFDSGMVINAINKTINK